MRSSLKLLVVGGYGTFGGRLIELLKDEPRLEIVVAGLTALAGAAVTVAGSRARHRAGAGPPDDAQLYGGSAARHLLRASGSNIFRGGPSQDIVAPMGVKPKAGPMRV